MALQIILRLARTDDLPKRKELVSQGFSAHFWDAFWYFFLQELTLECCVLAAAVLFIFCGASVSMCLALVPAAAVLVMLVVSCTHCTLAEKHSQSLHREWFGVVAEASGALLSAGPACPLHFQFDLSRRKPGMALEYLHLVGTASVSEDRDQETVGWLHALAVHPEWRARGIGRALAGGAQTAAVMRGLRALGAVASHLQPDARAALLHAGWRCHGAMDRPLLGSTLVLPLVRLDLDLPLWHPGEPDPFDLPGITGQHGQARQQGQTGQPGQAGQQGTQDQQGTSGQPGSWGQAPHRYV